MPPQRKHFDPVAMFDEASFLEERDVRAITRLIGEVAGADEDLGVRKRQLMVGLARLVGAHRWHWSVTYVKDHRPKCRASMHGGLDERQLTAWADATRTNGDPANAVTPMQLVT
jgi:hypothetical protein